MNVVIALSCGPADVGHITSTIKSLQEGNVKPHEIVVTLCGGAKAPSSLKKRAMVTGSRIYINSTDINVQGSLAAVVGIVNRYKATDNVYIIVCDAKCDYPPHLLQEYATSVDELNHRLKEKLPDSDSSIYGVAGTVMAKNKNLSLEREFQQLIGKTDEQHEERNMIGYVRETATIDFLESCGSILLRRSQLKDDFMDYLKTAVGSGSDALSSDVILSNYFAKHKILRTQICTLTLNRFMLNRCGYQKCYTELPAAEKQSLFEKTVRHLRAKGVFYCYE